MNTLLRLAIIGTSMIAHKLTADFIKTGLYEPRVVFYRSEEHLNEFQKKFNFPIATNDLQLALGHPEVDVVYIGLPNHLVI